MTEQTNYQRWYNENKQSLSEKRKLRYKTDPVYRQKCLDAKAKQTKAKQIEPVDPIYTHNQSKAADAAGVSLWILRSWRDKGYIPEPHEHHKALYFTGPQVELLKKLAAKHLELGKAVTTPEGKAEMESLSDLVHANWS